MYHYYYSSLAGHHCENYFNGKLSVSFDLYLFRFKKLMLQDMLSQLFV